MWNMETPTQTQFLQDLVASYNKVADPPISPDLFFFYLAVYKTLYTEFHPLFKHPWRDYNSFYNASLKSFLDFTHTASKPKAFEPSSKENQSPLHSPPGCGRS